MRLADRLALRLVQSGDEDILRLAKEIISAPKVVVDNVCDYVQANGDSLPMIDRLPCCRPPFDSLWIEWKATKPVAYGRAGGLLLRCPTTLQGSSDSMEDAVNEILDRGLLAYQFNLAIAVDAEDLPQIRVFAILGFDPRDGSFQRIAIPSLSAKDYQRSSVRTAFDHCMTIVANSFAFMHCKNVIVRDDAMPDALAKKFRRKHGRAPVTFKTLEIVPLRQFVRGQQRPPGARSDDRALSICRGHFKDYRKNGLFGKAKGIFWWDQHLAGTADRFVENVYDVKAPS